MPIIKNFGDNVRFTPPNFYQPESEHELLSILEKHRHGQIRVVGSKHAWSDAIVTRDALIDVGHFNSIKLEQVDGRTIATVGGGCQIKHLLAELNRHGLTTPSIGLITEQTIAGAISTATHGSGKHCLSHYITALRIACYTDDGNEAIMREVTDGPELQAARCSLGCLGVITQVTLPVIPQYMASEQATPCETIEEALSYEPNAELQQMFLMPHSYSYYAQERAVSDRTTPSRSAWLYSWYWYLSIDIGLHVFIKLVAVYLKSRSLTRFFFKRLLPLTIFPAWKPTDRSDRILVMEHELFRHLEMELFVPRSRLIHATHYVTEVLQLADGQREALSSKYVDQIEQLGLTEDLHALHGVYCHHYPICIRRVLTDDTLIASSSRLADEECWYSISFITYVRPREPFYQFARFLARSMAPMYQARPHWGKWFPLTHEETAPLYPKLEQFREIASQFDPHGTFRNEYVTTTLGFTAKPGEKETHPLAHSAN